MSTVQWKSNRAPGKAYLFNITNQDFFVSRTYGHFHLLPANPGAPWQVIVIEDTTDRLDMGEEQYHRIPILAEDVAQDIANEFAVHGIGVCKGPRPTAAEVAEVRGRLEKYYRLKLNEGDSEWSRSAKHENIDDVSRRAAIYFGEPRPWAYQVVDKITCPGCAEKVPATIAKCKCGAIIDVDRAVAAGLLSDNEAERLRKMRKKLAAAKPAAKNDETEAVEDDAEELAKQSE